MIARFTPAASRDVLRARRWYDSQEPGLGREFAQVIGAASSGFSCSRYPLRSSIDRPDGPLWTGFPTSSTTSHSKARSLSSVVFTPGVIFQQCSVGAFHKAPTPIGA